ncbi:MAG: DNA translocase FtsK [Leptospira sp.]|nr:DNA translocase FtsK [Leptospira sp.]
MAKKEETANISKINLKDWQKKEFVPYAFLFLGVFILFSLVSFQEKENALESNWFGRLGYIFSYGAFFLFGKAVYIPGFFVIYSSISLFKKRDIDFFSAILFQTVLLFTTALFLNFWEIQKGSIKDCGGFFGEKLSLVVEYLVGSSGRLIVVFFLYIYSFLLFFRESPFRILKDFIGKLKAYSKEGFDSAPVNLGFGNSNAVTTKLRLDNPPWFEIGSETIKDQNPVSKAIPMEKKKLPEEMFRIDKLDSLKGSKRTIFDGFFEEESRVYRFNRSPESLIDKMNNVDFGAFDLGSPDREHTPVDERITYERPPEPEEKLETQSFDDSIDVSETVPEIENKVQQKIEIEIPETLLDEISSDNGKNSYESRNILEEPTLFPLPATTVPEIRLRKKYSISKEILKVSQESKRDPLFKLEAENTGKKIEEIIKQFGYESKVVSFEKGPIITRYELTPPPGIKLSRITSLSDELKLYLEVESIRIVAPIPGKSMIGIEVPNRKRENVFLGDVLRENSAVRTSKDLSIVIGKDISGKNVSIDLNRLPHLLVAGTTGSGKSVAMNSMISSLLFTKSPEDVRFIMIDPKMVEFALYENVPHLLMPVITDPRKATKALSWAIQEMEARYINVSNLKCRDLKTFNEKVELAPYNQKYKKMPYIVIFIDELSDLMMVSGKDLEDYITRISQKARAVGIHLVMATQRPSVDVITPLIKANCPARIAFQVAQKTDSRVIMEANGAESLLGKGDFLYKSPTAPDLQRIQSPYISEPEIESIVEECKKFGGPEFVDISLDEQSGEEESSEEDETLFDEAWNIVRTDRKASASYLQRRMRIGYNKAARLMEMMEERGYVGPQIGSKPREILKS